MLALVPLLILRFGFATRRASSRWRWPPADGDDQRRHGFRRVDSAKIALARSYGASTLQIFWKIRAPMALPMIWSADDRRISVADAVGAEWSAAVRARQPADTYSSMIQMPQFLPWC